MYFFNHKLYFKLNKTFKSHLLNEEHLVISEKTTEENYWNPWLSF